MRSCFHHTKARPLSTVMKWVVCCSCMVVLGYVMRSIACVFGFDDNGVIRK